MDDFVDHRAVDAEDFIQFDVRHSRGTPYCRRKVATVKLSTIKRKSGVTAMQAH